MTKDELSSLPAKVRIAIEAGKAAAAACTDDGGSANLDRVVIPVPGLRPSQLQGLPGYVQKKSRYHQQGVHLDTPWPGQGNQHSAGVQAMHKSLKDQGVNCYVYYQVD
ncbi:hypothetical protein HU750_08595 [Pseudomonas sp. SWRI50]|uniref:hypothetical protein n=1 Tax=Pseudomonas sp. SWRI50 TaxID=2745484 RepID=UPI001645D7EA|nr:hypothetical protein [Pseudomonas sp. SWRI50]MBC3484648.1 hypothetical protein [Pseudomonas sp. SWRI50]MBC3485729.1 hypothetical protein [Pseudomonas sp. SWRI50]